MRRRNTTYETIQLDRNRVEMTALGFGRLWCAACARKVSVVTVEQASILSKVSVNFLLDRIGSRRLHFRRRLNGSFIVCLESLIRCCGE
jgi:hypothetical protein